MTSTIAPTSIDRLGDPAPPAGPDGGLTASDRAVLARALGVLQAARRAAASTDPAVAAAGRRQLSTVVGYITGFMDATGGGAGAAPGLGALFPPDSAPDLGAALDQLESLLESVTGTDVLFSGVGDAVVALGEALVAVGHALQAAGI